MADAGIITPITRCRTLSRIACSALVMGAYGALPVWKEHSIYHDIGDTPTQIHAALTLVLGWLLVFRTNTAYSRWWEARTLWGGLVNACRNLAAKLSLLVRLPAGELQEVQRLMVAFPYALRDHLRNIALLQKLPGFEADERPVEHIPGFLVEQMYAKLRQWKAAGLIDGDELRVIDEELRRFLDICGGCERIQKTRLARSYRVFARQCVCLFLGTFPWGIVNDFGWWTIPITAITAYFMLGLEVVAEHVEEPFGFDEDDLDLDGLCETISRTAGETFRRQIALTATASPVEASALREAPVFGQP